MLHSIFNLFRKKTELEILNENIEKEQKNQKKEEMKERRRIAKLLRDYYYYKLGIEKFMDLNGGEEYLVTKYNSMPNDERYKYYSFYGYIVFQFKINKYIKKIGINQLVNLYENKTGNRIYDEYGNRTFDFVEFIFNEIEPAFIYKLKEVNDIEIYIEQEDKEEDMEDF